MSNFIFMEMGLLLATIFFKPIFLNHLRGRLLYINSGRNNNKVIADGTLWRDQIVYFELRNVLNALVFK